jgi:hypothetical protein
MFNFCYYHRNPVDIQFPNFLFSAAAAYLKQDMSRVHLLTLSITRLCPCPYCIPIDPSLTATILLTLEERIRATDADHSNTRSLTFLRQLLYQIYHVQFLLLPPKPSRYPIPRFPVLTRDASLRTPPIVDPIRPHLPATTFADSHFSFILNPSNWS